MNIADLLPIDCVRVPLAARNKTDAIKELVDALAATGRLVDRDRVLRAVLDREATRSTGIGYGLAVPHGKSSGCPKLAMAIGKPAEPIDFESSDGKPVSLVVLIASPPDQTGPHIQALAQISRLMLMEEFRKKSQEATSSEALHDAIVTCTAQQ